MWDEAEGEVEGEIGSAIRSSRRKNQRKLKKWKIITFSLLFVCYVGVYVCGGCLQMASSSIQTTLGYTADQVSV